MVQIARSLCLITLILCMPFFAHAYVSPGAPTGHVNDFAQILTVEQRQELEARLTTYTQQTTHEIAVVTIPALTDETIETYAEKLFQEWGIGKTKQDNGVLLLISRDDRKLRIEVGYGLEPELTDAESSSIIRNIITPEFQKGNYYSGISNGVTKMTEAINADLSALPEAGGNRNFGSFSSFIPFLFIPISIFMWLMSVMARSRSWWAGGIFGGIVGAILLAIGFAVAVIPVLVILGLLLDFIVSRGYQKSRNYDTRPPWWTGGGWGGGFGGGSSGGGGFGGFGGGRSGGGGSSGSW